jgi:hypothetical protein
MPPNALLCMYVHSSQQKSVGLKYTKPRSGSNLTYSCHHNSCRLRNQSISKWSSLTWLYKLLGILPLTDTEIFGRIFVLMGTANCKFRLHSESNLTMLYLTILWCIQLSLWLHEPILPDKCSATEYFWYILKSNTIISIPLLLAVQSHPSNFTVNIHSRNLKERAEVSALLVWNPVSSKKNK